MMLPHLPPFPFPGRTQGIGPIGPGHPLWDYLFDPWGTLRGWAETLLGGLAGWPPGAWTLLAAGGLATAAARGILARSRRRRRAVGARWVAILPPPTVDPATAEGLWANLAGLLPQRRRRLAGQPHIAFEYCWSVDGLTIGIWVPGTVAPRLVEQAVEAACPGASAKPAEAPTPAPPDAVVLAGRLRLAGGDWLGLRTEHHADPLRALLGAAGELSVGETATVQVLARPASRGHRLRLCGLAKASARVLAPGDAGGGPLAGRLLDLVTSGVKGRRVASLRDLTRGLDARAILARITEPAWEVSLRYAVVTTTPLPGPRRLRARAHALTGAYALYAGRNQLTRTRQRHPGDLTTRRFAGGTCCRLPSWALWPICPWTPRCPAWPAPVPAPSPHPRPRPTPASRSATPRPAAGGTVRTVVQRPFGKVLAS